jgi:hypothetical protein
MFYAKKQHICLVWLIQLFFYPAIVQMYGSLCSGGNIFVVCNNDECLSGLVQLVKEAQDFGATCRVEVPGRLVGKYNYRVIGERAGDGDPLLLASTELCGPMPEPVAEADGDSQLPGVFGTFVFR